MKNPIPFFATATLLLWLFLVGCANTPAVSTPIPTTTSPTAKALPPTSTAEPEATAPPSSSARGTQTDVTAEIPGRLVLITKEGQMATVDPDGGNLRQLTSAGLYQFPAWSPDSQRIAVIGNTTAGSGVFTTADETDNLLIPIYNESSPIYLYWHPDSQQVSFIANHPDGLALRLAPADASAESTVLATGQPFYWQWLSPERAATHASGDMLRFVDVAGNGDPTGLGRGGFYQSPAVSAEANYFAYSERIAPAVGAPSENENENEGGEDEGGEDGEPSRQLVVWDAASETELFSQMHRGALAMSWNPTAPQLAYTSPTQPEERGLSFGPLRLYDVAAQSERLLTNERVLAFFWSPDGRFIAYITVQSRANQQAEAAKTRVGKWSHINDRQRGLLTLSIVDVATGIRQPLYSYRPTLIFLNQFMPFFDQYAHSHRLWSPDSQYLVIPALFDGETADDVPVNRVMLIPISGQPAMPIAEGVTAFWSYQ